VARLWSSGFELQSALGGVEFDSSTGTAPTISTTTVRSGAASLRLHPSAATSYIVHRYAANAIRNNFYRFCFNFASFPTADATIFSVWDGSSGFPSIKYVSATGVLQCQDGTPSNIGSASAALSLNTWYRVDMQYNDTTGDIVNAFLNGAQFCTGATGGNISGNGQLRVGLITSTTADMFIDDVAANDDTGSFQTSYPGEGHIVHLQPNAAGDNNGWATAVGGTAGAVNNFTRVSEITPDALTSYNATALSGTTTQDDFNVTDTATAGIASGSTITLVGVGARVGSSATTAASIVTRLKSQASGTTSESASISVAVNGFNTGGVIVAGNPQPWANIVAYQNTQSAIAWTTSTVDTIQIGYRTDVSQTTTRRVTTMWALVEYVPVVAANAPAEATATTAVASDAATALGVQAAEADATASAGDAQAAVGSNAAEADASTVAADAQTAIGVQAAEADATATAYDASVSTSASPTAGTTTATAVAADAQAGLGANADQTSSAAVSYDAGMVQIGVMADQAAASAVAPDAVTAVGLNAGQASASAASFDATVQTNTFPNAEATAATATAYDATVSTASNVSASAQDTAATAIANDASVAVTVNAEAVNPSVTGLDAVASSGVQSGTTTASAVSLDASVSVAPAAGAGTATSTALDAGVAAGVSAESASAGASAFDATVSTSVSVNAPAELTSVTAAAQDPAAALGVPALDAAATATALSVLAGMGLNAGAIATTATAYDATVVTGIAAPAGFAAVTADAQAPTLKIDVYAEVTYVSITGFDAHFVSDVISFAQLDASSTVANDFGSALVASGIIGSTGAGTGLREGSAASSAGTVS
jgi:hypothetical protein